MDAYREVFEDEVYRFEASSEAPFIIDAGGNIREIRMEIHQNRATPGTHDAICEILREAGFEVTSTEQPLAKLLPEAAMPWFRKSQPQLFIVAATRRGG